MAARTELILGLLLILAAPAQRVEIEVGVHSVFLNVSVQDSATGSGMRGLTSRDFVVYEDGVQQQIVQFTAGQAPLNALLLIDNSGSTRTFLHMVKAAAVQFMQRMKADDRVAIVTFNSRADLVQDFTLDRAAAARALLPVKSEGGTALYDALAASLETYMRPTEERKAIVLFTDGVDNQLEGPNSEGSGIPFSGVFRRMQEADSSVYVVFLDSPPQKPAPVKCVIPPGIGWPRGPVKPSAGKVYETARRQLQQVAEQSGGRMYTLTRAEDLAQVYEEIAEDLRGQYLIGYNPSNRAGDGKWRRIRVEVSGRPAATVRTREGYYLTGTDRRK